MGPTPSVWASARHRAVGWGAIGPRGMHPVAPPAPGDAHMPAGQRYAVPLLCCRCGLGAGQQAADVGVVAGIHKHGNRQRELNGARVRQPPGKKRCQREGNQRGERRSAQQGGGDQPGSAGSQSHRPGGGDQHAVAGGDALAALEAQPNREEMASTAPNPAHSAASRPASHPASSTGARPWRRPAAEWRRPAPCGRCAGRWWLRYCRSRWCGCPAGPPPASAAGRTGSSRTGSRAGYR